MLGKGNGRFQGQQRFPTGDNPSSTALGDFDGDGVLDLAVTNSASNDVSILIGQGDESFLPEVRFPAGLLHNPWMWGF